MSVKDKKKAFKRKEKAQQEDNGFLICVTIPLFFALLVLFASAVAEQNHNSRKIKLVSMDFNIQQIHRYGRPLRSGRWDLFIRVPKKLVGDYMCLQGNLQASFLYKNVTLATSSIQSYNKLDAGMPHLLSVSAVANEEDLSGAIGKEIMEAMKERNEVRFGSRLSLSDCREEAEKSMMSYECDETTLRFEPSGSDDQFKATAFGERPTCKIS